MNHVELCELINKLRTEEGNRKELDKTNLWKKVKKEVNTMKTLGLDTEVNFYFSEYKDKSGKMNPTYLMNRDAILQMAASESVYVRAKIIEYINVLENKLKQQDIPSYQIEDKIDRAKAWIKEAEVTQRLLIENTQLKNEIEELEEYKMFKNMLDSRNEKEMYLGQFGQWLKSNTNIKTGQKLIFAYCKENGLVKYEYKENYATAYAVNNQWLKNVGEFADTKFGTKLVNKIMITNKGCLHLGEKLFKEYLENTLNQ